MSDEQIRYVLEQRAAGHSDDAIKLALRSAGYSNEQIDELYSHLEPIAQPDVPAIPTAEPAVSENDSATEESTTSTTTMYETFDAATLPSTMTLLQNAFSFVLSRMDLIGYSILATLILAIPFIIASAQGEIETVDPATAIMLFFMIVIGLAGLAIHTMSLLYITVSPNRVGYLEGLKWGVRHVPSYVLLMITLVFVIIGSTLLLVIPAFIISIYTYFTLAVFVREDIRGSRALVRSSQMVWGVWWPIFWRVLAIGFAIMILSILFSVALGMMNLLGSLFSLVSVLISVAVQVAFALISFHVMKELYEARVGQVPAFNPTTNESRATRRNYRILFWLAPVGMLIMPMASLFITSIFYEPPEIERLPTIPTIDRPPV